MTLTAIKYESGHLEILNQLVLPEKTEYITLKSVDDGWKAIKTMQVRGAPAIAIVGCLSLAVELREDTFTDKAVLGDIMKEKLQHLVSARPTAVNMRRAADDITELVDELIKNNITVQEMKARLITAIEQMLPSDINDNKRIGTNGVKAMQEATGKSGNIRVLTHCNTGSLATAGYGTALGIIRSLHAEDKLEHVYCTETRPYNQGSRLTAYECVHDNLPATLVCDNMVAALMNQGHIDAVVVGADRVAANGDTANKIGTYQIAILAKHHNIPFFVAAPCTSIDLSLPDGSSIQIEERSPEEMTHVAGIRIAAPGIKCWNPAFDVTPAELITGGIVTEKGMFSKQTNV